MDEEINHFIGQNTINSRGDPADSRKMPVVDTTLIFPSISSHHQHVKQARKAKILQNAY